MKRTDITYGQLDKALRSMGFSFCPTHNERPARFYLHEGTGAEVALPDFPDSERVYAHHLIVARTVTNLFGIAEPMEFDAKLERAGGSNGASRPARGKKRRKPAKGE